MRVKAVISYDGSAYFGFQRQTSTKRTISTAIETALASLQIHSNIVGSGRTDAGVHAKQMYAHFDTDQILDCEKTQYRLNSYLCDAIHIKSIFLVSDSAHARFDATARVYEYWLCQHKNPFLKDAAWLLYSNLDFDLTHLFLFLLV